VRAQKNRGDEFVKAWFLKLHRWIALVFALPLLFVLGSALILAFEPWAVVGSIEPGSLTSAKVEALLAAHDPGGQARGLVFRTYDKTLTIGGGRGTAGTVVDITTGKAQPAQSALTDVLVTARRIHERLAIDASWLVIASTIVMLVLAVLGVLLGFAETSEFTLGLAQGDGVGPAAARGALAAHRPLSCVRNHVREPAAGIGKGSAAQPV
jgi:hypothetical protein